MKLKLGEYAEAGSRSNRRYLAGVCKDLATLMVGLARAQVYLDGLMLDADSDERERESYVQSLAEVRGWMLRLYGDLLDEALGGDVEASEGGWILRRIQLDEDV